MIFIARHEPAANTPDTGGAITLALRYDARRRSRQRVAMPDGSDLAIALPPGSVLGAGDLLVSDDGTHFVVRSAPQPVLRAVSDDPLRLLQAAYHLGNRHVPVQVTREWLQIEPDSVLRDLLLQIGLAVEEREAPFQPESGAYAGGHRHGHDETFAEDYALAQAVYARHD